MTSTVFDDEAEADAADRQRGKNDRDTTHIDKDAKEKLRAFIHRVERLEEDKQAVADDIKAVYAEAKGTGFDVKAMRQTVRRRRMDQAKREEQDAMLELYEGVFR